MRRLAGVADPRSISPGTTYSRLSTRSPANAPCTGVSWMPMSPSIDHTVRNPAPTLFRMCRVNRPPVAAAPRSVNRVPRASSNQ